jgi:hypothetical protein
MTASSTIGGCPFCGAPNPTWYTKCERCHRTLPEAGSVPRVGYSTSADPLAPLLGRPFVPIGPLGAAFGGAGILWFAFGVVSIVVGVFLLVAGSLFILISGYAGQPCSINTLCLSSSAFHIAFVASGLALLLAGVASMVHGFSRNVSGSRGITLPP